MSAVQDGNSATITFATSVVTGRVVSIGALREFRNVLDDTALADTSEKSCPGSVKRTDEIDVELIFDLTAAALPPLNKPELITITFPKKIDPAQSVAPKISGTGFITGRTTPTLENDTEMHMSYTIKLDSPTFTAGS